MYENIPSIKERTNDLLEQLQYVTPARDWKPGLWGAQHKPIARLTLLPEHSLILSIIMKTKKRTNKKNFVSKESNNNKKQIRQERQYFFHVVVGDRVLRKGLVQGAGPRV